MTVSVRHSVDTDIPSIFNIEQHSHLSPWSEKLIASSYSSRNYNFVAEVDGLILGYMFTSFVAGELTLENICVAKEQQGKGVGKQLMKQLFIVAKELKAEDIWLEVRASNDSAIHLYKEFGFEQQGVRKNYYSIPNSLEKEDAILMRKKR